MEPQEFIKKWCPTTHAPYTDAVAEEMRRDLLALVMYVATHALDRALAHDVEGQ